MIAILEDFQGQVSTFPGFHGLPVVVIYYKQQNLSHNRSWDNAAFGWCHHADTCNQAVCSLGWETPTGAYHNYDVEVSSILFLSTLLAYAIL